MQKHRLVEYLKRAKEMPLNELIPKVAHLAARKTSTLKESLSATFGATYSQTELPWVFHPLLTPPSSDQLSEKFPELFGLLKKLLDHKFDLLGSGWVSVSYSASARGFENHCYSQNLTAEEQENLHERLNKKNQSYSASVRRLISEDYEPIDWQKDFKSGYRWDESQFHSKIPYGHLPGVDIKVPWELSRCQHYLHLAYGHQLYRASEPALSSACLEEFIDQILDFISQNPPQYGANWKCPMDVAIRAANWCFALNIFVKNEAYFTPEILGIIQNSIVDHYEFVKSHFEKSPDFRGNHYLANIAGLATVSAFFHKHPLLGKELTFFHQELINECEYQFFEEGTNFEGSTAYHRLSAEMLLFPTLAFLNLPPEKLSTLRQTSVNSPHEIFPDSYWGKIARMADACRNFMAPNFQITQFGDNDSGRFLKAQVLFNKGGDLDENFLDLRPLAEGIEGLFLSPEKTCSFLEGIWTSQNSCAGLLNNYEKFLKNKNRVETESEFLEIPKEGLPHCILFSTPSLRPEACTPHFYPEMGYFFWKSEDFHLALRCGPRGQLHRGGHDHNDQLSVELYYRGKYLVRDPGTYVYTPSPERRNRFRSAKVHFSPLPGLDEDFSMGLFALPSRHSFAFRQTSEFSWLFQVENKGIKYFRSLSLRDGGVEIKDSHPSEPPSQAAPFSPSYGVLRSE